MHAVTDRASPYATLYKEAFSIVRDPLVYLFPAYTRIPSRWIPYRYRARQANERLRQILYKIIEDRKQAITDNTNNDQSKKDLLTMMIEASVTQFSPDSDSLGSSHAFLTDGELVSNLAVFFVAGHETTASATASMIYYLASHPEIQERARMEVLSILGDDDQDVAPTEEQLRQMPFLNNCIKETMRINPPTSGNLPRIAAQDTRIGDFFIPKGTPISLELYCVHHLAKYWHEPQVFNPDRFDPTHASYMKDAIWMPFGYGPRTCIGSNFSLFEQRVLHAMLLKRYTWSLVPNSEHANGLQNQRGGGIGLLGPETLHIQLTRRY
ncbi:cytochrome P450 [Radiomyces spectabilis]|uniref:cytochrome P450 n=1 Tax=Radiomyces spectabilis TaxID=64574 RepID=UPI00221FE6E4|nr:cytochrome P450 [Radiomyces spectabilis]KAI8391074.1 cytochrome P450 [Radiomyces spectabilis]